MRKGDVIMAKRDYCFFLVSKVISDHHKEEDVAILWVLSDHYVVEGSTWRKKRVW